MLGSLVGNMLSMRNDILGRLDNKKEERVALVKEKFESISMDDVKRDLRLYRELKNSGYINSSGVGLDFDIKVGRCLAMLDDKARYLEADADFHELMYEDFINSLEKMRDEMKDGLAGLVIENFEDSLKLIECDLRENDLALDEVKGAIVKAAYETLYSIDNSDFLKSDGSYAFAHGFLRFEASQNSQIELIGSDLKQYSHDVSRRLGGYISEILRDASEKERSGNEEIEREND